MTDRGRDRGSRRLAGLPRRTRLVLTSLVAGIVVGTVWGLVQHLFGQPWGDSAISGAIYGTAYGVVQVPLTRWMTGRTEAYRTADQATRKAAEKALFRGPAPHDHRVRALAHEMAVDRLPRVQRVFTIIVVGLLLLAAGSSVLAVVRSAQAWVAVVLLLAVVVLLLLLLRRLRRRAEMLAP